MLFTNLKALRLSNKWSQAEFSKRIGISRPWLSMLENGRLVPTDAVKRKLEMAFGAPAEELLKPAAVKVKGGVKCGS